MLSLVRLVFRNPIHLFLYFFVSLPLSLFAIFTTLSSIFILGILLARVYLDIILTSTTSTYTISTIPVTDFIHLRRPHHHLSRTSTSSSTELYHHHHHLQQNNINRSTSAPTTPHELLTSPPAMMIKVGSKKRGRSRSGSLNFGEKGKEDGLLLTNSIKYKLLPFSPLMFHTYINHHFSSSYVFKRGKVCIFVYC